EDGSVIFSDYRSWHEHREKPFSMKLSGHEFSGSYLGVCALKVDSNGDVDKFACGGFMKLERDGKTIFSLDQPADIVVRRTAQSEYNAIIVGAATNHFNTVQN
ncbi:MAG TPA: hypothetical protein VGY98_15965, partial [Verrucomicrobiae bacterium]|nr:hypothetical protein [Verrucomicrobiae bacterium]